MPDRLPRAIPVVEKGVGITPMLNDPFYTGESAEAGVDRGFPISIGGRPFLVDLSQRVHGYRFQRSQVSLLSSQQQSSNQDNAQVTPEVWRRLQDSWHQGSGQTRLDRDDSLPARFITSSGVSPWEKYGFSLLRKVSRLLVLPAGQAHMVAFDKDCIIVAVGASVWTVRIGFPPVQAALTGAAISITTDGLHAYVLQSDGKVAKVTAAGGVSTYATVPKLPSPGQGFIAWMKARLVVGSQNTLYDVTGGGGTAIQGSTHPIATYHYVAGTDGLAQAYVLGGQGDRWQVLKMGYDGETATFEAPSVAAPLPEGEVGYALGSYLGYVTIGVSTGWRFAVPSGGGDLTYGRLIETQAPVRSFDGQDRFVWYTQDSGARPNAGLGRADLSTFISPNTPAVANDLEADAVPGIVRNVSGVSVGAEGVGFRVFTVDGRGVYIEEDEFLDEGQIDMSLVSFNTADVKRGVYAQVAWESRPGGVEVQIAYNSGSFQTIADLSAEGSTDSGNLPIPEQFVGARLRFILKRDPATPDVSPRVTRWEIRALPTPGRASEWRIPLILHEALEIDGMVLDASPKSDFDFLLDLVEQRRTFTYRERGRSWQVYATDYIWEPWRETRDGDTYQGLFVLSLREMR